MDTSSSTTPHGVALLNTGACEQIPAQRPILMGLKLFSVPFHQFHHSYTMYQLVQQAILVNFILMHCTYRYYRLPRQRPGTLSAKRDNAGYSMEYGNCCEGIEAKAVLPLSRI